MPMVSIDTETTGVSFNHGCMPFLVTFCNEEMENTYYEWDVNPLTRLPKVIASDVDEIIHTIETTETLVLQNPRFDVQALATVLLPDYKWPWDKTVDTLLAGHLLASNHPHDLSSMVLEYLGIDIDKYDEISKKIVNKARSLVTRKGSTIDNWRIAKKGLPELPSAKGSVWKNDLWLPRAIVKHARRHDRELLGLLPEGYRDWTSSTATYANYDSASTLALYIEMRKQLKERKLWKIYKARLEILEPVYTMEKQGVSLNGKRLTTLQATYKEESAIAGEVCNKVANHYDYELILPKSGNNKNLSTFVFDVMKLDVLKKSKKTGAPSLNKDVLAEYQSRFSPKSIKSKFVCALSAKRKRDAALSYMEGYTKFWLSVSGLPNWWRLFPSLNPTGTDTLRFSSSNPNEQNISKKEGFNLRYAFGPAPGREWWSLDCKNQELRIPAYVSNETEMIKLFENSEAAPYYGSVHLLNFHTVYPDIWEKESKLVGSEQAGLSCKKRHASSWYQWCKNGNFAVQYGSVEGSGTADRAYHRPGSFCKIKERFKAIHGIGGLNDQMIMQAEEFGYVNTMPDRTVDPERGYPLICGHRMYGRISPTIPLNYYTQGTACWVMFRAMVKINKYLKQLNKGMPNEYQMILQIHDEVVLDFPKVENIGNLSKVKVVQKLMSSIGNDLIPKVPLPVSIEYHPVSWGAGETV